MPGRDLLHNSLVPYGCYCCKWWPQQRWPQHHLLTHTRLFHGSRARSSDIFACPKKGQAAPTGVDFSVRLKKKQHTISSHNKLIRAKVQNWHISGHTAAHVTNCRGGKKKKKKRMGQVMDLKNKPQRNIKPNLSIFWLTPPHINLSCVNFIWSEMSHTQRYFCKDISDATRRPVPRRTGSNHHSFFTHGHTAQIATRVSALQQHHHCKNKLIKLIPLLWILINI